MRCRRASADLLVTDNVTLDVVPGELHAIIGPNGAGKTTLINQISGAWRRMPAASSFAGRDVTALPIHARALHAASRDRSRSRRSCRRFRRWRMSRWQCRRAPASSFRFFGRADDEAALNEPAMAALQEVGLAERVHVSRRASFAWRAAGARTCDCARDASRNCCCWTSRWPAPAARRPRD